MDFIRPCSKVLLVFKSGFAMKDLATGFNFPILSLLPPYIKLQEKVTYLLDRLDITLFLKYHPQLQNALIQSQ